MTERSVDLTIIELLFRTYQEIVTRMLRHNQML